MKKNLLIFSVVVTVGTIIAGCNMMATEEPDETPIPVVQATDNQVSAESFIQPVKDVNLTFETSGRIIEILVEEGDIVNEGDVVARLDDTDLRMAVEVASATLERVQAELAEAKSGPTEEEITQARAKIMQAEAELVKLLSGATPEEIALAEAQVRTRRAQLNQVMASARDTDLDALASDILLAEIELRKAQTAYDEGQYALDTEVRAAELAKAQSHLSEMRANYEAVSNGATDEAIAVARAELNAQLASLKVTQAQETPEKIAEAQIAVQEAEVGLAKLLAGNTDETIAIQELAVNKAEISLQKALRDLDDAVLVAPFAGVISHLELEENEFAMNGKFVMTLADTSEWLIETDDLTEIDIVGVQEGQLVNIEVDALPDETFTGIVTKIKPQSETKAGDVTFTVEIKLDGSAATDSRLRWGMTVQVDIVVETL